MVEAVKLVDEPRHNDNRIEKEQQGHGEARFVERIFGVVVLELEENR